MPYPFFCMDLNTGGPPKNIANYMYSYYSKLNTWKICPLAKKISQLAIIFEIHIMKILNKCST